MTLNCVPGPEPSSPLDELPPHSSSRPKTSRVGTPDPLWRVGSGSIQRLYQAWMPGQYAMTAGAWQIGGAKTELLDGSLSIWLEPSSSFHVLPKSVVTQTPFRYSSCGAPVLASTSKPVTPLLNLTASWMIA